MMPDPARHSPANILIAARGGGISFAGQLFQYGSSFIFSFIVARFLGAEDYGTYRLALTITTVVGAFSFLGLNGGVARYLPIYRSRGETLKVAGVIRSGVGIPLAISSALTLALFLFGEQLSAGLLHKPTLAPVLGMLCLVIPMNVLLTGLSAMAQGFKNVEYEAYARNLVFNLAKLLLSVAALLFGLGLMGISAAYLLSAALTVVVMTALVSRLLPLRSVFGKVEKTTRELLRFSLPLYLSRLLNQFSGNFETLLLGYFGVLVDVGIYAVILRISELGNLFFSSVKKISVPIIAELHSQGRIAELRRFYQTTTKWSLTFNLPIFLVIILFGDAMLQVFGKEFTAGSAGLAILALGVLFNTSTGACGTVINMTGYTRLGLLNSVVYLLTTLVLDFILIPRWQLLGAALAGALTIVIVNTLRLVEVYYLIDGMLPFNRSFWKPAAAALLTVGIIGAASRLLLTGQPYWQLGLLAPALLAVYSGLIVAFKLSEEDRAIVDKVLARFLRRKSSGIGRTPDRP